MAKLTRKFITDTMNDIRRRTAGKEVTWRLPPNYAELVMRTADPFAKNLTGEVRRVLLNLATVQNEAGLSANGADAYDLLKKAKKYNEQIKKLPTNQTAIRPVAIKGIRTLAGLKRATDESPKEGFDRKVATAKTNLTKSLTNAGVPESIIDAIQARVGRMGASDFHNFASSFGPIREVYGSNTFMVRPRLVELIEALNVLPDNYKMVVDLSDKLNITPVELSEHIKDRANTVDTKLADKIDKELQKVDLKELKGVIKELSDRALLSRISTISEDLTAHTGLQNFSIKDQS